MRAELGASVRHVVEQMAALAVSSPEPLRDFFSRLDAGPVSPLTFAVYSDLVYALNADESAEAERLLHLLVAQPSHYGGLVIKDLADRHADENSDRYVRYVDSDSSRPYDLIPPTPETAKATRARIADALALGDAADPELVGEIRALIREIILCSDGGSRNYSFDGASSLMLWGAIVINAGRQRDNVSMLQMLTHESAHNLLFGLCPDEPLLNNDPDKRYASPLRTDLRPLEGIFHATFVSARMHRAALALSRSEALSSMQRAQAGRDALRTAASFFSGLSVLDQHADLTEPGRAILENAREYMTPFRPKD